MGDFILYRGWHISRDLTVAYRSGRLSTMYFYGETLKEIKSQIDSYWR